MKVFSLYGGPGCGKTTELVRRLERFTASGVPPERITFVSFTKAAAAEAVSRVGKKGFAISTIHSLCYHKLGLKTQVVVNDNKLVRFFGELGIPYFRAGEYEDHISPESSIGNEYLKVLSMARAIETPPHDMYDRICEVGTMAEFSMFLQCYNQWKDTYGFLDFDDMLEASIKSNVTVDADVLIVDEAQDLSFAQWATLNSVIERSDIKEVHIAGDDDQCVYSWCGADPNGMQKFEEKYDAGRVVLSKSHRLPAKIHALAMEMIDSVQGRVHKNFSSRPDDGVVERWSFAPDLDDRDTLVLARTNATVYEVEKELIESVVPYERIGNSKGAWRGPLASAVKVWKKWGRGEALTDIDLSVVARSAVRTSQAALMEGRLKEVFEGHWKDHLRFTERGESFIEAAYDKLDDEIRVRVGTIHSSKGMEADRVMLHTAVTPKILEGMEDNPDNETRVFYVGVTRAKHQLDIIGENDGYRI